MVDDLHFTNNDLQKAVKEFAEEYFYDLPLLINNVSFGKGNTKNFGLCIPEKNISSSPLIEQNLNLVKDESKIIPSSIEINGYLKELNCSEPILHEMCHAINFTNGDYDANHGKLFKEVADIISSRTGYNISTSGTDQYLDSVLGVIEMTRKVNKEPQSLLYLYRTLLKRLYDNYEDLYVKAIEQLNSIKQGIGNIMADLIESGVNIKDKDILDNYANKLDELMPKYKQYRLWYL